MLRIGCTADCSFPWHCADSLGQAPSRRTRENGWVLSNQSDIRALMLERTREAMRVHSRKQAAHLVVMLTILAIVPAPLLQAQVAGGTIQGTVADTSGRVIPEAMVSIRNLATGVVTGAEDNDQGLYTAPNLVPGAYEVTCSAKGFSTTVVSSVALTVGAQQRVDFVLKPSVVREVVVVQDLPPAIDLATSTLSNVVNERTVRELPLNGRDWTQLATLEAGVAAIHTQVGLSTGPDRGNRGFGSQLTISGGRPAQNNYRLDGVSINDYSNGAPGSVLGSNLGVDAVEEFSVLTSNYSAEYGRTSGGVINAVTKSGTNLFHGTVYEFLRNSALDARNFFDASQGPGFPAKPPFKRNQFGASAGGPLIKDKTFIFGDFEGDRQATGISTPITVPTNNAWDGLVDGPVDPKVLPFRIFFPVLNDHCVPPGCPDSGNFTSVVNQVINENYFTVRGDHKLTSRDSLVGTYVYDKATETQPDPLNVILTGNSTKRQIVTAEHTHAFSATLINSLRFGFNRVAAFAGQNASVINATAKDNSVTYSAVPGQPAPGINIGGGVASFQGGLGASPNYRFHWNSFQIYDDAFVTKGIHFLKFGFASEYIQDNILASSDANGVVVFANLANFLGNSPGRFDAAFPGGITERQIRQHIYAGYVQDDIRLRSNLTVNAGLRYEMASVPTEVHGRLSTLLTPTSAKPHLGSPFFSNPTLHNFEPRVGFAWDPLKTGKTSLRGGVGMFDVLPLPYLYSLLVPLSAPFFDLRTISGPPPGSFPDQLFGQLAVPSTRRQAFIEPHPKRNYTVQWNLNVQREFAKGVSGMVAYVGSRAVHQAFRADDINTSLPLTPLNMLGPIYGGNGTLAQPLMNQNAGQISSVMWSGDAHYHALQTKLTARTSSLQAQASYTWGKSIDTGSATVGGDTFLNSISSLPFFNPALRRGPSDFNIVHNLVLSYTWILPGAKNLHGPASWFLGGWQLGGVVQLSSGIPFTATIDPNSDPLGLASTDTWDFPDRVGGAGCNSLVNAGNVNGYIKTQCLTIPAAPVSFSNICSQQTLPTQQPFAPSPPGQITCTNRRGNLGRNALTGPPLKNFDFSLFKNMPVKGISETFNIQFRAEIFNIFNHPNFAPPLNHLAVFTQSSADPTQLDTVAGAGQLDSTVTTSRQIQFGLKLIW
jgi:hypothetical protein